MRPRHALILLALLAALLLAACGATHTVTVTHSATATPAPAQASTPRLCPPGRSFAGCSITGPLPDRPGVLRLAPVSGPEFPDVSNWQGHPDWGQVFAWQRAHGWPTGGFFKLGEYSIDPDAAYNAAALRGHFSAAYWFVRNTGCQHEGGQIVAAAKAYGVRFVWDDVEVSEARGYSACLLSIERRAGLGAGVYTGPGTWTHDSVPSSTALWDAAYNFTGPSYGGLWIRHASCWQFTDGVYASRTDVPGIGYDDVNVDFGCIRLAGGAPSPSGPYAYMDHVRRHFHTAGGVVVATEAPTMIAVTRAKCRAPVRRAVCRSSVFHLRLLDGRLYAVAHRDRPVWADGRLRRHITMVRELKRLHA